MKPIIRAALLSLALLLGGRTARADCPSGTAAASITVTANGNPAAIVAASTVQPIGYYSLSTQYGFVGFFPVTDTHPNVCLPGGGDFNFVMPTSGYYGAPNQASLGTIHCASSESSVTCSGSITIALRLKGGKISGTATNVNGEPVPDGYIVALPFGSAPVVDGAFDFGAGYNYLGINFGLEDPTVTGGAPISWKLVAGGQYHGSYEVTSDRNTVAKSACGPLW